MYSCLIPLGRGVVRRPGLVAQGPPLELDLVAAVHHPVQDRIGQRRIVQVGVPGLDRQLAGDQRRAVTALGYLNAIRFRAYGNSYGPGNVGLLTAGNITLQFILDERARELYWEGHRRTDLIRYGLLTTGTYLWPWKGGVSSGSSVDTKYNLFAIPSSNIVANPNLTQNAGY